MRQIPERRNFIRKSFKGILLAGIAPGIFSEFLLACRPVHVLTVNDGSEDLKRLQAMIADKKNPLKWVFTGDSITQGARHTMGYRAYPEIFSEHIRFEMNRPRDFIINTAISGHATANILEDFEWRVNQFHPHVVSIMIGTNDAAISRKISVDTFENNLRILIQKFRSIPAIPIIHTPNIIKAGEEPGGNEREQLPLYVDVIRKVAKEMNAILVDHWSYWETNKEKVLVEKWLADPLHPGGRGHLEMARLLFKTLSVCDDKSFTCTGVINF